MPNNPIFALVQTIKGGGDPRPIFAQMMQQNPQVRQAMQLLEGKNPQQQLEMVRNMASERGVDLDQLAGQLGMPMKR